MTISTYIASEPTYEDMKSNWIQLTRPECDSILAKQSTLGVYHRLNPITLLDGSCAVCCDVISEMAGGVYFPLYALIGDELSSSIKISQAEFDLIKPII